MAAAKRTTADSSSTTASHQNAQQRAESARAIRIPEAPCQVRKTAQQQDRQHCELE